MPMPFDDEIEADFKRVLERMKVKEDAENGAGAFEHSVQRGKLMMRKRADELTDEEQAFLAAPAPKKQH